jgi:tetratricopeptide (TPR) repeat protein
VYSDAGQLERGTEALRRAVELGPDHAFAAFNLTRTLLAQGRAQEALAVARGVRYEVPRLAALAIAEHDLGHAAEAQRAIDALVAGHAQHDAYWVAQVHGWRGDRDRAMAWLARAFDQRDRRLFEVGYDMSFRKLHDDRAYKALLVKMRLPEH